MSDPFDTESLRAAVLSAWTSSPTRLREDSATESDLVRGGYRERLLTELAQNAADAAARGRVPGSLRAWSEGEFLHVANTGAPLDRSGVHALTALRVSAKTEGVGRFGVGFTAVRAVSDEIEFRSAAGGVVFSADRTVRALADAGVVPPAAGVPVLRLAWPSSVPPADGFDSEVVLRVRDADEILASMREEAASLLLELEALTVIDIAGDRLERTVTGVGNGVEVVDVDGGRWWQYRTERVRWLIPTVDDRPVPDSANVLRAPTRSDEELSLPAMPIADVAMQPDRRRVLPGADVAGLAAGYGRMLAALPSSVRPTFVPVPGFARSAVDEVLRESILREASSAAWLLGVGGVDLVPSRAMVLPGLTDELAEVLADTFPDLVAPSMSGPRHAAALAAVDVRRIGLARFAEMLTGVDREPAWWGRLYDGLAALVVDGVASEELAALPVPLADGRTVTGPRTTVLGDGINSAIGVHWTRLVHPDAARPLLTRLGAAQLSAAEMLSDPALEALLDELDWDDGDAVDELTDAVLTLAANADGLPGWLGSIPLASSTGELRAADELLLPDAPLAAVLSEDSPFGTVDPAVVRSHGPEALRAVGVGWGFGVVTDDLPTEPDHDLDDEAAWWASLADDPETLVAVRDLDLVDSDAWPEALSQLLADPRTRAALQDRDGYTAWWLRRHAVVDGASVGTYRAPSDTTFDGLLDVFEHPSADDLAAALAPNHCDSAWFTRLLIERLADPSRAPTPAVIATTHTAIADAVASGRVEEDDLDLPPQVRSVSGALVDPIDAMVLDRPWLAAVVDADVTVLSTLESASVLASVLDVRLASDVVHGDVRGVGRVSSFDRESSSVLACAALGLDLPAGRVVVHHELIVRLRGAMAGERTLAWWVTEDGVTHIADSREVEGGR
ncbi:sacsin N-terminal ATP-binding-like domain-containing protein [Rhodococcus sp. NPDC057297]|uniref:sacsin N-terminal ATP-binding-like domain-containing protein n=1 Tax=Rhodococcus sp. NPDC057297 TaxID=3346090 RepID=UPI0036389F76